jgi:predicted mannosyl-3-phosphoglycerate phosphatase (HAD superfamily)
VENKCVICDKEPLVDINTPSIMTMTLPDKSKVGFCSSHSKEELQKYVSQFIKPSPIVECGSTIYINKGSEEE